MKRIALLLVSVVSMFAFTNGQNADLVLGKKNFTSADYNIVTGKGLFFDVYGDVAYDSVNSRVYVADTINNRILWWNAANFAANTAADGVVGQSDLVSNNYGTTASTFSGPAGVALDAAGNLFVADTSNNRVLVFNAPITTGMSASIVLGQDDMTSAVTGTLNTRLEGPTDVFIDAQNRVYVADTSNNRVVRYQPTLTTGKAADVVLGQSDFGLKVPATTASGMNAPRAVYVDASYKVYVADTGNTRVMIYSGVLSNGKGADNVIGQAAMNTTTSGSASTNISYPKGVYADSSGNVFVADSGNNRIMKYATPVTNCPAASLAIGQTTTGGYDNGCSATLFTKPQGMAVDGSGNMYFVDNNNNRVVKMSIPGSNGGTATAAVGQPDLLHGGINYPDADSLKNSSGKLCFDQVTGRLYVADYGSHRILWWNDPEAMTTGKRADGVLGQSDFYGVNTDSGSITGPTASGFNGVGGIATDSQGNVYVSDFGNNRVLKFTAPIISGMAANVVLGQSNMFTNVAGTTDVTFTGPSGLVVDASGNLYVADKTNNRVLYFAFPITNNKAATKVLGQVDLLSGSSGTTAGTLKLPVDVKIDALGKIHVADAGNHRVVIYNSPIAANSDNADFVIGQANMTSGSPSTGQAVLSNPVALAFDSVGNLFVADKDNHRTLKFASPFATAMNTSLSFGQPDLTSGDWNRNLSAAAVNNFSYPSGVAFDAGDNFYAADGGNQRVVRFNSNNYTISGYIKDENSTPISDVTVTLAGAASASTTTSTSGYYQLTGIGGGSYTVTASKTGSAILPAYKSYSGLVAHKAAQDFTIVLPKALTALTGGDFSITGGNGEVKVVIPANTLSADTTILLNPSPTLTAVASQATLKATGVGVEITLGNAALTLSKSVALTLTYTDASISGLNESKLVIAYYNTTTGTWIPLKTTVLASQNKVVADVSHFSTFQVMEYAAPATLDSVKIYPNPFSGAGLMNFANLTASAAVTIYSISGEKVAELTADSLGLATWDGKTVSGLNVGSGVYFALINDGTNKKTVKIAVER